jgi:hypothetical protein
MSSVHKRAHTEKLKTVKLRQTKYNKPLHRIAARGRMLLNLKGYGWAANGD